MSVCRIAVCDDVYLERKILCELLQQLDSKQIIHDFSSGEDLLSSTQIYDLVFLDIYMNGITGMETAKKLKEKNPKSMIVFLTSSEEHAVESYEINAFDYIVKPLQIVRLSKVLERFRIYYHNLPKYYVLNTSGEAKRLPYGKIEFLESDCHYVIIHTVDGLVIKILGKLDNIEHELSDSRFLRCHKSYLVNLDYAKAMNDDFLMASGKLVPYRKREKKQLQNSFCEYLSGINAPSKAE